MTRSDRPTILHVLDDLDTGGSERQLVTFLLRTNRERLRHEVCALCEGGRFATELERAGIPVHILGLRASRDLARSVQHLWRLVRDVDPDVLHATLFRPGVVSRIVGRLSGKPVVTSLVNTTYEPEWFMDNPRLRPWKVWVARTIDGVTARWWGTRFVALNESVKTSAVHQLGLSPEVICVIPRGLSFNGHPALEDADVASLRSAFGWADAYPVILNVARLVPQKGQQYAVLAMKDVVRQFPSARLVIAGEGWLRPSLEQLAREQGLSEHVVLLGDRGDVASLLRAADIFLFPSLYEGAGNALVEAMAMGKPCVVSRIPTMCEVTGDGKVALLTDLRSPESLAVNVLRLAADRALASKLGADARAWVWDRHSIERSVAALESLYDAMLSGSPRWST
jgi:glycosyltransferase involved in cell wall biosynthesis